MNPDLIIAIDFGMTCTGVAYSTGPDWLNVLTLQKWPGKYSSVLLDKVPTALAYKPDTDDIVSWGAEVELNDPSIEPSRLFKLFLDPRYLSPRGNGLPDVEEARQYFKDYLSCIYRHIMRYMTTTLPRSDQKRFEFLFSTPTSWNEPSMIETIKESIYAAGFGSKPNHTVQISATEAEAAAIYTSKGGYSRGDVILVCDAGGGTTDIHVFRVDESGYTKTALTPLTHVEGENVGSTLIDYKVKKTITRKLESALVFLTAEPATIAERMMREGIFESYKCEFDPESPLNLMFPIKEMQGNKSLPYASIEDSKLVITRDEVKAIFDEQINRMFDLVDKQLRDVQRSHGNEQVNWLVLSGGLGSSTYVQERFRIRYELNAGGGVANAHNIKLLVAPNPQLAVVHGLVLGRTQELRGTTAVFTERRARNSYGVLCRQVYNSERHLRENVIKDERDKLVWAQGQIEWLVKQGEPVSTNTGVLKDYRLKINIGEERRPWKAHVVMSSLPIDHLPKSIRHPGVMVICTLTAKLDATDMVRKNHRWYHTKDEYYLAEFTIKIAVGSADLQFSILSKDRSRKVNDGSGRVQVEWMPPDGGVEGYGSGMQTFELLTPTKSIGELDTEGSTTSTLPYRSM